MHFVTSLATSLLAVRLQSLLSPHTPVQEEDFVTDDGFFDMISKCQGKRMDDQRTSLPSSLADSKLHSSYGNEEDDLLEALYRMQSSRIEDQRCGMSSEPPHIMPERAGGQGGAECVTSDDLFELIFSCQVSPPCSFPRLPSSLPPSHPPSIPPSLFSHLHSLNPLP